MSCNLRRLAQAYVTFFCFQEERSTCTVQFQTWEDFSQLLLKETPDALAKMLRRDQIDCVFGTIDLSIQ